MGPTWVLSAPDGPHVGPMNLAIRGPSTDKTHPIAHPWNCTMGCLLLVFPWKHYHNGIPTVQNILMLAYWCKQFTGITAPHGPMDSTEDIQAAYQQLAWPRENNSPVPLNDYTVPNDEIDGNLILQSWKLSPNNEKKFHLSWQMYYHGMCVIS